MMNYMTVPRPEYPRPQFRRKEWLCLNGEWEFEIDHSGSGRARGLYNGHQLSGRIIVPFCPESELSRIGCKDFMAAVWYRRKFNLPAVWGSKKVLLHFGAVDYETEVWVNGISVGKHKGGYSSFSFDITASLKIGMNIITVCAEDDLRSGRQSCGKQSVEFASEGCKYTRTTGIWQTVWLEFVPDTYTANVKYFPDSDNCCVLVSGSVKGETNGCLLQIRALYGGKEVGSKKVLVAGNNVKLVLELSEKHLWEPGAPNLYDLEISLYQDGVCIDYVESYVGLRNITIGNGAIQINGKPVFQKLVLDQGYYPEGIYTAPSDEALKRDIELAMELGFNGARMHQKVFEQRYLYWADRMGYIVWAEHASWGLDITTSQGLEDFLPEWMEILERDFNSPSIVVWCPFNETWDIKGDTLNGGVRQDDEVLRIVYQVTKAIDETRPVIDASGNFHVMTDIFDVHDYEQDPVVFATRYDVMKCGVEAYVGWQGRQKYEGQPYFVSEYGGIYWNLDEKEENGWGYGNKVISEEDYIKRFELLSIILMDNPKICGFCYTQLYDVEQEKNGFYTYDRREKVSLEKIKRVLSHKSALEQQ